MPHSTQQLRELDRQFVWHPFTPMRQWMEGEPLVIAGAQGMYLIDSDGNRYLDGVSSLWCNVHGHRVPEIDEAIGAQLQQVAHTTLLGLANEPATLLADELMRIVPGNLKKVFYSDSGATAAEVAFKMAAQYWYNIGRPEKNEFVGFAQAYHGDTVGAMSIGRMPAIHAPHFPMLFKAHFAPSPYVYRSRTPDDPGQAHRGGLPGADRAGGRRDHRASRGISARSAPLDARARSAADRRRGGGGVWAHRKDVCLRT